MCVVFWIVLLDCFIFGSDSRFVMFFVRDFEVCVSLLGYSWRAGVEARSSEVFTWY